MAVNEYKNAPKPKLSKLKNVSKYYEKKYAKYEQKKIIDDKWNKEQVYYGDIIYKILKCNKYFKNHLKKSIGILITLNDIKYLDILIKNENLLYQEILSIQDAIHANISSITQKRKLKHKKKSRKFKEKHNKNL